MLHLTGILDQEHCRWRELSNLILPEIICLHKNVNNKTFKCPYQYYRGISPHKTHTKAPLACNNAKIGKHY